MAIEITAYRPLVKNTPRAFVTLRMANINLEIRDATPHDKNVKWWLTFPTKSYQTVDSLTKCFAFLEFFDKPKGEAFQKTALNALDRFMKMKGGANGF